MIKELENGRYLTQAGLTIAEREPQNIISAVFQDMVAIAKLPEVMLPTALISGLSLVFKDHAEQIMTEQGLKAALFVCAARLFTTTLEKQAFQGMVRYFDTNPVGATTSPDDELKVQNFKALYTRLAAFSGLGLTVAAPILYARGADVLYMTDHVITNATVGAVSASALYRFHKTEQGQWALVGDTPKQKPKPKSRAVLKPA